MTSKYNRNNFYDFIFNFIYTDAITDDLIDTLLSSIDEREAMVVKLRFGLDCEKHTLKDIGKKIYNLSSKKIGTTGQRVKELESKAMRKFRHQIRMQMFIKNLVENLTNNELTIIKNDLYGCLKNNVNDKEVVNDIINLDNQLDISLLLKPIRHLELTTRSYNCLMSDNILFIGDLVQCDETRILKILKLGIKSFNEIRCVLLNHGLSLGMILKNWDKIRPQNI
jgi:hypothetical protein